jgi:hypothetical protein
MGTPSITVYLDYKGTPHTFVKLDDGVGNVEYYGFAPAVPGSSGVISPAVGKVGVGITTHAIGDSDNSKAAISMT